MGYIDILTFVLYICTIIYWIRNTKPEGGFWLENKGTWPMAGCLYFGSTCQNQTLPASGQFLFYSIK
jgi:hypothetical protein